MAKYKAQNKIGMAKSKIVKSESLYLGSITSGSVHWSLVMHFDE